MAEVDSLTPGTSTTLGVTFDMEEGWHLYWEGRNDSGLPISVEISAPPGFNVGETLWPAPERLVSPGGILDHVYEDRVTLLLPLFVPKTAEPGSRVTFIGRLDWVACQEMCVVGGQQVELTLPVGTPGNAPAPRDGETARLFREARARIPRPLDPETGARIMWDGSRLEISVPDASHLAFFPDVNCSELTHPIEDGVSKNGRVSLRFANEGTEPISASGVLELRRGQGDESSYYSFNLAWSSLR